MRMRYVKCILNSKHRLFVRKDGKMRTARKLKEEVAKTVGFLAIFVDTRAIYCPVLGFNIDIICSLLCYHTVKCILYI